MWQTEWVMPVPEALPPADPNPPAWVADSVFYQIFPDRFARSLDLEKPAGLEAWDSPPTVHGYKGGDLLGIVEKLGWIQDLGCDALYLNPIFQSASNHRYHTHDYYRVDPLLGGDEAFDALLKACRRRGVRVMLDGVLNHASRGFFQFNDLLENGPHSPWLDWFDIHDFPLGAYDDNGSINYRAWWGLPALPEFNTDNPQVREYLMQVGEHWARKGIDGWRLDVPGEITTPGFWEEFRARTRAVNPELYLVGEIWDDAREWIVRGDRFDATMNYLFAGATISFAANRRVDPSLGEGVSYELYPSMDAAGYAARIERLLGMYPDRADHVNFNLLGSHDTPRVAQLAGGDGKALQLAALLLLTFPGAPSIYYGDEIGLLGGKDPDNRRAFPWSDPKSWDCDLYAAHQDLIRLRRTHAALRTGGYARLWPPTDEPGDMLYVFAREGGGERMVVAANAGDAMEVAVLSSIDLPSDRFDLVWGNGEASVGEHAVRIAVPPQSGAVWRAIPAS